MILLLLACSKPPACPSLEVDHPLDSAKTSVQLRCPGEEPVQMFSVRGGVHGERPQARLSFCAEQPAAALQCGVPSPLLFDARLPVDYQSWESPAEQPEALQGMTWTALRGERSWDVHGTQSVGEAELLYSVHVPMPARPSPGHLENSGPPGG